MQEFAQQVPDQTAEVGISTEARREPPAHAMLDQRPTALVQRKIGASSGDGPRDQQHSALNRLIDASPRTRQHQDMAAVLDRGSASPSPALVSQLSASTAAPEAPKSHAPAPHNGKVLPLQLKAGIEALSGMSMDDVEVHRNSPHPNRLDAHAYAQGNRIFLGAGQEQHLPHEAWHVVQQKQGRVAPTMQSGDAMINDDPALEREADAMGAAALAYTGNGAGEVNPGRENGSVIVQRQVRQGVIQRETPTGIENRANDCFLNALIHLIGAGYRDRFDPAVRRWAQHHDVQDELWAVIQQVNAGGANVPQATIGTLREHLYGIQVGRRGRVVPSKSAQEDASEVLQHLLELTLDAQDQVAVEEQREYAKSVRDAAYTGDAEQLQTYTDRKARQTTRTSMIGVDLDQYVSFHDFLYHEFGAGSVATEFDAKNHYAIRVGGEVHRVGAVSVQRRFVTLPPVLTFHLHRFRVGPDGGQQRINRRFDMPQDLVLRSGTPTAPRWERFELQAYVVQHGSLSGGHYTAARLTKSGWLTRDDAKPSEPRPVPENIDTGYLYTYRSAGLLPLAPDTSLQDKKPEIVRRDLGDEHTSEEVSGSATRSDVPEGKPSKARLGLPNASGSDCFMNVALQMISGPLQSVFASRSKHPVLGPILTLADDIAKGGDTAIEAERIATMRALLLKHELVASDTGQEDATELLLRLLNLAIRGKDQIHAQRERSFEARDRHDWTGERPKGPAEYTNRKSTERMAPANSIPIDIVHFDTLEQFLAKRFHDGVTTSYDKANRPKVRQDGAYHALSAVTEKHTLLYLPDVLVFVLNRSVQDSGGLRRLDKPFFMPPTFTIGAPRDDTSQFRYRLTGVVMHTGSREQGHYRAWMQQSVDGEWLQANDSTVTSHEDPGAEQHQGYLYTYAKIDKPAGKFDTPVETLGDLTASALLIKQVRAGNRRAVQQMLDSGGVSVQTIDAASGKTALHAAVEADTADEEMIRILLRRGADPGARDAENYTAIERADGLGREGIAKLMRQPGIHDVGSLAKDVKGFTGTNRSDLQRMYNRLSELSLTINGYYGNLLGKDDDGAAVMVHLEHQLHQIRHDLNRHASVIHGVRLGGAGGRPDTHKVFTDPRDADLATYLTQLDKLSKGAKGAYERCQEKASKNKTADASKPISESLTAAYAQPTKEFRNIGPWSGGGDLEYNVDGVGWDQKAMYVGKGEEFKGRLHHTQTKSSGSTASEAGGARNGLLLDATVSDPRNYELIWEKLFTSINRGELNPKMIREVQTPLKSSLKSNLVFDTRTEDTRCNDLDFNEKAVTAVTELDRLGGKASDGIRVIVPPGWLAEVVKQIYAGGRKSFSFHKNDRYWLPGGRLYYEASASRSSKVKIVFDHDMTHFYVTPTHYEGYSIRETAGLRFCQPFYEINTTGLKPISTAETVTVDEASETATPTPDRPQSAKGGASGSAKKGATEPAKSAKSGKPGKSDDAGKRQPTGKQKQQQSQPQTTASKGRKK
ncbi:MULTISPECIES: DUF4157 domain-containing protein [Pandoraea]|uniref:eCIS core domain-containing protein n=1 Tax=Pandoraea TaxID=93217 RepID=UPI001F5C80AF|nr:MULTISPECIES: DUF4157 domain-containing protein [Pandoraea]MCI3208064.1 hypothetical protein [Pandoraea sp. LA3]MDN4586093.1 hypothetical protein [Pandoraea capi]